MNRLPIHILILLLIFSCEQVENFTNPEGPVFTGQFAPIATEETPAQLRIITYNIEFAEKINQAIEELKTDANLRRADVILLQEMDEIGSELIAKSLEYNYVYYPGSIHEGNMFGLTILSKWPIGDHTKIILPHATPGNGRRRIATVANVLINEHIISVYNIHSATFTMPKSKRRDQFMELMRHFEASQLIEPIDYAIIAGDFNTDKSIDIHYLVDQYRKHDFAWANENVGPTWQNFSGLKKYRLDHVFAFGFMEHEAGTTSKSQASDHLPIWAILQF